MNPGAQERVQTHLLRPGVYMLQGSAASAGPYRDIGRVQVTGYGSYDLRLPTSGLPFYRLLPLR